jgi:hypothetical protein
VKEEELETGAGTRFSIVELNKSVQRDQLTLVLTQRSGVLVSIVAHENVIFASLSRFKQLENSNFVYEDPEGSKIEKILEADIETLLRKCFNLVESYVCNCLDIIINLLFILVMLYATEGERKLRSYKIIGGDVEGSFDGYGYMYYKKENSQEIHRREEQSRVQFCICE